MRTSPRLVHITNASFFQFCLLTLPAAALTFGLALLWSAIFELPLAKVGGVGEQEQGEDHPRGLSHGFGSSASGERTFRAISG